jgi:CheY-like chemotaxis protein
VSRPLAFTDAADRTADAIRWSARGAPAPSNEVSLCVADLSRVFASAVDALTSTLGPNVRIVTESPRCPPVRCDEVRLARWITQLAADLGAPASARSDAAAEISIAARPAEDWVTVTVRASPCAEGVSVADAAFRADAAASGVGVSLRRRDASLEVELRIAAARLVATDALPTDAVTGVRRRVAVIDDDELVGRSIERILGQQYDIERFTDARAALAAIASGARYAMILCDLMMPEMTGMSFAAALEGQHPEVVSRCVWMTGGAFTANAVAFLAGREDATVEKPFNPRSLRTFVASRLGALDEAAAR